MSAVETGVVAFATPPFAALADWGTSNLRIWLVDEKGTVLDEAQSGDGMAVCSRDNRFATVLESHLDSLAAPKSLPVIVAGMAGARGGWREAPYAETPSAVDRLYEQAVSPDHARPVHILPGLCQKTTGPFDVMRGEETQIAGVVAGGLATGIICMPGTHCKWVDLEDGKVQRFRTAMTGELFDLIAKQSILRLSIPADEKAETHIAAFEAAVTEAFLPGFSLATGLFSIRAATLLSSPAPHEAASRLSGLLIGAELAGMRNFFEGGKTVHIVASPALAGLYLRALTQVGAKAEPLDGSALVRTGLFAAAKALI
ncbi:2-dehydro-3-deoxygalactonokinase [Allorhizobium sp. BGMRC 0089]|uniref:2-dehydro-3-deoxygalactonokinase n=1 Tax=Allorhizobium sonneratiae TaxID=2934936 RepID=UPI0020336B8D|nr:2-dehydro-3-deoxygalactonokinase [Allorhizobium sonneratiae]MCM2290729.1 2-dehydro-3-deoxygalactonokinase [Allorhizobium sonneratiae]